MGSARVYYATVGFGDNPAPHGPWSSAEQAADVIRRWVVRAGDRAGHQVASHSIRVHGYTKRLGARQADIGDTLGVNDCISIQGLDDFLADHEED